MRDYTKRRNSGEFTTTPCAEAECDRFAIARAMCKMHYRRWARAHGMERSPSNQWNDAKRSNYHARRARAVGNAHASRALLTQVIERDGTRCASCSELVDLSLTWPHPMYKSLDHVQPLSKGGGHTLANAQLMHFRCNSSKGNRTR